MIAEKETQMLQTKSIDDQILEKIENRETERLGFHMLVQEYQKRVYWHIRKMVIDHDDADDLTQETFIKVWKKIKGFKNQSKLYTWIYKIATNTCLSFLEKKKKRFLLPIKDVHKELTSKVNALDLNEGEEIQRKLQRAVIKLPNKQKLVFNMKYYDEMKYEEISEILDTSVGSLKATYHHAVKKIEEELKRYIIE